MINMSCDSAVHYEDIDSNTIFINGVEIVVKREQYLALLNTFDEDNLDVA